MPDTWLLRANTTHPVPYSSVAILNGKHYQMGGWDNLDAAGSSAARVYDPATDAWANIANLPASSRGGVAAVLSDGLLYSSGGVGQTYRYDEAGNSWTSRTSNPTPRNEHGGGGEISGKLYRCAGYDSRFSPANLTAETKEYNPTTDSWAVKASIPTLRRHPASCVFGGRLWVFGGETTNGDLGMGTQSAVVESYDPASDSWQTEVSLPAPRSRHIAVSTDDAIYIGMGITGGSTITSDWLRFDPGAGTFATMTPIPVDRYGPAFWQQGDSIWVGGGGTVLPMATSGWTQTHYEYSLALAAEGWGMLI